MSALERAFEASAASDAAAALGLRLAVVLRVDVWLVATLVVLDSAALGFADDFLVAAALLLAGDFFAFATAFFFEVAFPEAALLVAVIFFAAFFFVPAVADLLTLVFLAEAAFLGAGAFFFFAGADLPAAVLRAGEAGLRLDALAGFRVLRAFGAAFLAAGFLREEFFAVAMDLAPRW